MGLNIPAGAGSRGGLGLSNFGITLTIHGAKKAQNRMKARAASMVRVRTTGINRVGKELLEKKKLACKMGLYSGEMVAPNKWRFGWSELGKAKMLFTKSVYNSHRLENKVQSAMGDGIDIVAGGASAPHAAMIHGPMEHEDIFWNRMIKKFVRTRPWMKADRDDVLKAIEVLFKTYKGL